MIGTAVDCGEIYSVVRLGRRCYRWGLLDLPGKLLYAVQGRGRQVAVQRLIPRLYRDLVAGFGRPGHGEEDLRDAPGWRLCDNLVGDITPGAERRVLFDNEPGGQQH